MVTAKSYNEQGIIFLLTAVFQVNLGRKVGQLDTHLVLLQLFRLFWKRTNGRVSNRSAGTISSIFPGVSRRHFDQNEVHFAVFFEAVNKLNEEACGDRPHPMTITRSVGELPDTY